MFFCLIHGFDVHLSLLFKNRVSIKGPWGMFVNIHNWAKHLIIKSGFLRLIMIICLDAHCCRTVCCCWSVNDCLYYYDEIVCVLKYLWWMVFCNMFESFENSSGEIFYVSKLSYVDIATFVWTAFRKHSSQVSKHLGRDVAPI